MFLIPNLRLGAGVDYNIRDESLDFILGLGLPIRRGGVVGGGSNLVVRWIPARGQTFSVGLDWPLWGSNMGKTRPKKDYVRLDSRKPRRLEKSQAFEDMDQILANEEVMDDAELRNARLYLVQATRQVMSNGLGLLGVSAPEQM